MNTMNLATADTPAAEVGLQPAAPAHLAPEVRAAIVARILKSSDSGIPPNAVRDEMTLRDELGLASIDSLELALDLEEDLGVVLEDEELFKLRTVGDLMTTIAEKLSARQQAA